MTYQQLIKKLRWGWRFVEGQDISNRDLEQAATSIEELVEERDELAAALDENWVTHQEVMQAKMQRAKAVEALRKIGKTYSADGFRLIHSDRQIINMVYIVLAELEKP